MTEYHVFTRNGYTQKTVPSLSTGELVYTTTNKQEAMAAFEKEYKVLRTHGKHSLFAVEGCSPLYCAIFEYKDGDLFAKKLAESFEYYIPY